MAQEFYPLSQLVASNALLEQGIVPGEQTSDLGESVTPGEVGEITKSIVHQVNDLPVSDERKDRVLNNAAERVEEQAPLFDPIIFKRAVTIHRAKRAHARRHPLTNPAGVYYRGDSTV
jgi:hypothetical protein